MLGALVVVLKAILVLDAFFLILIILLQAGRGEGIGAAFGASSMQSAFGTKAGAFLIKVTAVAAGLFFVIIIVLTKLTG